MSFAKKWMELDSIMLISQTKKSKYKTGGVAQFIECLHGKCPEFKPQYHQKKEREITCFLSYLEFRSEIREHDCKRGTIGGEEREGDGMNMVKAHYMYV
jgi:hypothetical protein